MALSPYREPAASEGEPEGPPELPRELGALRSRHEREVGKMLRRVGAGFFALGLVAIFRGGLIIALTIVGIGLCWAIYLLLERWVVRRRGVVDLHVGGIVVHRPGGSEQVLFADVDEVWFEVDDIVKAVRLVTYQGRKCTIPLRVDHGQYLLDIIQQACSARLLPEALRALAEGSPLQFDSVEISNEGMRHGTHFMPWSEVTGFVLTREAVVLRRFGKRAPERLPLANFPHPWLFIRLVHQLASTPRSG